MKINPGASIQVVQNGLTIRHPALPPVPESPPQPLPPLNLEALSTTSALQTQFFGNPAAQQLPVATGPSSLLPDTTYHTLFKREKNESKRRVLKDETVVSSLTKSEKSVAKRDIEETSQAETSNGKVRAIGPTRFIMFTKRTATRRGYPRNASTHSTAHPRNCLRNSLYTEKISR